MRNPTDAELADLLFAHERVELVAEDGVPVPVSKRWTAGEWIRVTAPRLLLEDGLHLTGHLETRPGVPWSIELRVESAWQTSPGLDEADLRIVSTSVYPERRAAPRVQTGGAVTLTAHYASEIVADRQHSGELDVISELGCAVSCTETFAIGDHLTLSSRGLLGRIEAEMRISSIRRGEHARVAIYGGPFVRLDEAGLTTIRRIVAGVLDAGS